jgi:hypothetical protein
MEIDTNLERILEEWRSTRKRKAMTRKEWRKKLAESRIEWARAIASFGRWSRAASSACVSGTSTSPAVAPEFAA